MVGKTAACLFSCLKWKSLFSCFWHMLWDSQRGEEEDQLSLHRLLRVLQQWLKS